MCVSIVSTFVLANQLGMFNGSELASRSTYILQYVWKRSNMVEHLQLSVWLAWSSV